MSGSPVNLSSGLPETVIPAEPAELRDALAGAFQGDEPGRRQRVAALVEANPRSLDCWAALGDLGRDRAEAYACYRVGYHRGLDTLRANGWRGSGYVRWRHESNRGFLRALAGLGRVAAEIGETDEASRCADFVRQLDPDWDRISATPGGPGDRG
ncbi:MAG: DUF3151 domain-containing protein [Acidimicrobiales bacterium]